jgi:uncharacterized protein YutE (UPF0331/DUF86 family)
MMSRKLTLLESNIEKAKKAAAWLEKSRLKCEGIDLSKPPNEAQFDVLENLTSRFARYSDILFQKVFRLIDQLELESQETMLDTLHKAAKRGFLDDSTLALIREARNAVAHEYSEEDLNKIFLEVRRLTPVLLGIQSRVESYCKKFKE